MGLRQCKFCFKIKNYKSYPKTPTGIRFSCKKCYHSIRLEKGRHKRFFSRKKVIESIENITKRPNEIKFVELNGTEYLVSPCSEIIRIPQKTVNRVDHAERLCKKTLSVRGYHVVSGLSKIDYVHQIVALAYSDSIDEFTFKKNKLTVNHKDFNKINNHVDNLEIITSAENTLHSHVFADKRKLVNEKPAKKRVYRHNSKTGRVYYSRIKINGIDKYLGSFFTEKEAISAYDKAFKLAYKGL